MSVWRLVSRASSTAQLTATVVVPAPPLAPKRRPGLRLRAVAAGCRPAHGALERILRHRPHEELVRAGAHRLQDELGIGRLRNGEDRRRRMSRAQPLDRRHASGGVATNVHEDEIRGRLLAGRTIVFE